MVATLLCHVLAAMSDRREADPSSDNLGGLREDLALEMVRNQVFYKSEDLSSSLDRVTRLWRDYGPGAAHHLGGREPADILKVASGIEVEDFLALGLALVAFMNDWTPDNVSMTLAEDFAADIDDGVKSAFLRLVALDRDGFATEFADTEAADWDFLAFQSHPVLRMDGGLIVIDENSLVQRFSSGLYWIVHDYLKDTEGNAGREA
jgi:hypothetical protein